ncbi:MAG: D-galactosaminyltransferase [Mycobacterium sp.]|nr:D-galactosaminyltransferase [Mycobacterium sp.]
MGSARRGRLGSHTNAVSLAFEVLLAVLVLVVPGAIVACASRLPVSVAIAVGPALTYGVVALAIVPFGAVGIPWNAWTAFFALVVVTVIAAGLPNVLKRYRDRDAETRAPSRGPALTIAVGVLLGAALIGLAAVKGLPHWQSIPSTWDAVWHANTVRFILDTGQASPTHMGELRNVETHDALYYPSTFHAVAAVFSQLTGAAPTTAYTLNSVAVAVWLFPASAAILTWKLLRGKLSEWQTAGAAATAAALSASFTAIPYVEFDTASMPNLAAYGIAVPTMALVMSAVRHRDRIPLGVLALLGVFSVHITGGVVTVVFVVVWWLVDALWHPVRGRLSDFAALVLIAAPTVCLLLPQFVGVLQQAEIIEGHAFITHEGKKRGLIDAVVQHTRHLNDFPIQWVLVLLAGVGAVVFLVKKVWWPLVVWLGLVVCIVHSSAPFGGPLGALTGKVSDLFYSDPRRLSAVVAMLLAPAAGIGLLVLVSAAARPLRPPQSYRVTAAVLVVVAVVIGICYLPRGSFLFGEKYDSVVIDKKDLEAFAYLATLPDAHDTLIGNANTDGTAWMYAVAGLHPLWTHYDYPVQQGPGYHRFVFWAFADDADTDPRIAEAVKALNIRYVLTSTPVVLKFAMPDGLVSLDKSKSWEMIYDNGETKIYEWRGA